MLHSGAPPQFQKVIQGTGKLQACVARRLHFLLDCPEERRDLWLLRDPTAIEVVGESRCHDVPVPGDLGLGSRAAVADLAQHRHERPVFFRQSKWQRFPISRLPWHHNSNLPAQNWFLEVFR
ncbi:hypothetical protein [Streptomyces katrae]|uniref:hypothetical protein n=1 Tax=Streptomyces katrae TaxID=68223 RepID=UPI00131BED8E|nr:hypothetical protein [Streptomyces katrae]